MNDRNPVAEAGQAYLDRLWDAEKYRDELKDQLGGGVDIGELMGMGLAPGFFIERAGGLAELLRIIAQITEFEGALKEAEAEYIKARRFAEAVESAEMHADVEEARTNVESYISDKHGAPTDIVEASEQSDFASRPLESFSGISVPPFPRIVKDSPQA